MRDMERKMEEVQENVENMLYEELREREDRKINLVRHGVEELGDHIVENRERRDADGETYGKIFRAMTARTIKTLQATGTMKT